MHSALAADRCAKVLERAVKHARCGVDRGAGQRHELAVALTPQQYRALLERVHGVAVLDVPLQEPLATAVAIEFERRQQYEATNAQADAERRQDALVGAASSQAYAVAAPPLGCALPPPALLHDAHLRHAPPPSAHQGSCRSDPGVAYVIELHVIRERDVDAVAAGHVLRGGSVTQRLERQRARERARTLRACT